MKDCKHRSLPAQVLIADNSRGYEPMLFRCIATSNAKNKVVGRDNMLNNFTQGHS